MTQKQQPNRQQRRAMAFGWVPQYTRDDPITRAVTGKHKKPWQLKQAAKALADHGIRK